MKKIAILSDVHGNQTAFEAVLKDAKAQGATEFWLLGDLILPGSGDEELFELVRQYKITTYIKGNWEDCYLEVLRGDVDLEDASDIYIAKLTQHLYERLSEKSRELLAQLPLYAVKEVCGLRIGVFHNLKEKNYGRELYPTQNQENFDQLFAELDLDAVVYGHTHHQLLRYSSQEQLIINPGSVGQPFVHWAKLQDDLRAQYGILVIDEEGIQEIRFRKAAYDSQKELAAGRKKRLPFQELYQDFFISHATYTHDQERLKQVPEYEQYVRDVTRFLEQKKAGS